MSSIIATAAKLSHKQFRAMLKKFRRKKKRQQLAREREHEELLEQQHRESSPNYKERELERLRNSELFDQFEERENLRKHKQWLIREQQAQVEFRKKQEVLEIEKLKREEERKRIVAEFEQQQYVETKAAKEASKKEEVLQKTLSNLPQGDEPWHNPFAPESNAGHNPSQGGQEREQCQFFVKTGCCRFGDRCSRGHIHPTVSCTILINGMYSHFSIGQTGRDDFDTDNILEYEDNERYQDFKNFYFDVLPEFKKYGKVVQFKVCSNHEPHLRGNVYVQFAMEEAAVEAYKSFNGRYYAGKQMTCQFTHVIKWRSAICGLSFRKICPKGINCNFLHVFKNPDNEFWEADRDLLYRKSVRTSYSSRSSHSRSVSERRSSRRDHSSERRRRHRDATPEYNKSNYHGRSHHHAKSTDSDSDGQENGHYSSSRSSHSESRSESSCRSHHKRHRRDSKSESISPSPSDRSEHAKKHKKSKHKKEKKSKKSKKEKKSDES